MLLLKFFFAKLACSRLLVRGCLKSIVFSRTLGLSPLPPFLRGVEVPLFKGDLGGSENLQVLFMTFQTSS